MRGLLVGFIVLALTACNDDDVTPGKIHGAPDAKAGGIYHGKIISEANGVSLSVSGVILETGRGMFVSEDGLYAGTFKPAGQGIDTSFTAYAWDGSWGDQAGVLTGNIKGRVYEREALDGSYTLSPDYGKIDLVYDAAWHERGGSFSLMDGHWGFESTGGYAITVTVSSAGELYGSDTDGCTLTGDMAAPDAAFNAFRVDNVAVSCPSGEDTGGSGVAFVGNTGAADYIWVALTFGKDAAVHWIFYRR